MKGNKRKTECKIKKYIVNLLGEWFCTCYQKGITLIALIITIIVMLILVGVTINIALNGELFKQAQKATNDTQKEIEKEQQLSSKVIEILGEEEKIPDELSKYLLGKNGKGRELTDIWSYEGFKDDKETNEDETKTIPIKTIYIDYSKDNLKEIFLYGEYKGIVYRISASTENNLTKPEGLIIVYTPTGREGQDLGKVTGKEIYNGWTILYDYGNKIEAIAPFVSDNKLTLGGDTLHEAIEKYNNAITIINDYVKQDTTTYNGDKITKYTQDGTTKGVRSIGAGEEITGDDDVYISNFLEEYNSEYNGILKISDMAGEQDCVRMFYHGSQLDSNYYWIASRTTTLIASHEEVWAFITNTRDWAFQNSARTNLRIPKSGQANYNYGNAPAMFVRPIISLET